MAQIIVAYLFPQPMTGACQVQVYDYLGPVVQNTPMWGLDSVVVPATMRNHRMPTKHLQDIRKMAVKCIPP